MDARWDADADRLTGRANRLLAERRVAEALELHERAVALGLDPLANGGERWMAAMLLGDFERAWAVSDLVLRRAAPEDFDRRDRPFHRRPVWNGAPLEGRRVLVRCYHGLGDILHMMRYLPPLAGRARGVAVQAREAVHALLAALPGVGAVLPLSDDLEVPHDVAVELMELPHAFRTTLETLPAVAPYVTVDAARVAAQAARLRRTGRLAVGIAWAAGAWDGGGRSIPAPALERLAAVPGVDWVCLQRGPALEAGCGLPFCDAGPRSDDVLDTAAMIRALDLVVSVDTMVAHLAGALGAPVWTLLRFAADWRWMVGRDDSPWYPTMRLFRQEREGDWTAPLEAVARALVTESR
ncbi:glycosyltransferase family 9 protein [Azospirillum sp.]|uniref:glycosyltransferase family 9 protein n=1 Tax=Azospirillum sp. TaxID=34012 RepID=UPI003D72171B